MAWLDKSSAAITDIGKSFSATADDTISDSASNDVGSFLCVAVDVNADKLLIDFRRSY